MRGKIESISKIHTLDQGKSRKVKNFSHRNIWYGCFEKNLMKGIMTQKRYISVSKEITKKCESISVIGLFEKHGQFLKCQCVDFEVNFS